MGFESTLTVITNTPFVEEYKAIKAGIDSKTLNENSDPVAFTHRIPTINTVVDARELFQEFGSKNSAYNIACVDLLLELYLCLDYKIKQPSVMISKTEKRRLGEVHFEATTKQRKLEDIHIQYIHRKHIEPQQEYFSSVIKSLWEYKKELLAAQQNFQTNVTTGEMIQILSSNPFYKDKRPTQLFSESRDYLNGVMDSLLAFENSLNANTSMPIEEKLAFSRELMEFRVSFMGDHIRSLKDEDSVHKACDKKFICQYNQALVAKHKAEIDAVVAQLEESYTTIDLEYPKRSTQSDANASDVAKALSSINVLSETTLALGKKLFGKDRTDITKTKRVIKNFEAWTETLFSTCMEAQFHSSFQQPIKTSLDNLINSLKKDMVNHPALYRSDLIPLYVEFIKAEVSLTLGIDQGYTLEDCKTVRKAILTHKDYALISNHSHKMKDKTLQTAILVGLGVILFTTAAFLTLALTPQTARYMSLAAGLFASGAQGYIEFAATTVAAPAALAAAGTAAVVRFRSPAAPMPHSDIIASSKWAYNNRFVF